MQEGVQLAISVLYSVQAYWRGIFILPKKVLNEMDEVLWRYIWSGSELKKIGPKVSWGTVK